MPAAPQGVATNQHGRILIVDDEPYIREILLRWLLAEGYACQQAEDTDSALRLLQARGAELMISDIRMPGRSGLELLAEARARFPDLAVIMLTAVDDRTTAVRTLEAGAYGYVIKPFDRNELLISVVNALERRRLTMLAADYQRELEAQVRQRTEQLRMREEEIALRLVTAAEHRDAETGAHIRRIGLYSEIIARARGWDASDAEELRMAAPMHDVGKIGIPDHILLKPGSLTSQEFRVIERHTTMGADILSGSHVPLLRLACQIALTHHERWDGAGYPHGLSSDEIPEAGRIVAIADVYDALVHTRVYRPALSEEQALHIMRRANGRQFDPDIFDTFLNVLPDLRKIRERLHREEGGDLIPSLAV
jgi:putative two-component system response regulator